MPLRIVASIESARSVIGLGDIASWRSEFGAEEGGRLTALLVSCDSVRHADPRSSNVQVISLPQRIVRLATFFVHDSMYDSCYRLR